MQNSERSTIGGATYEVTKLPYTPGKRLLLRLYKVAGPAFGQGLAGALEGARTLRDLLNAQTGVALGRAVGTLAETLTEEAFDEIVSLLADYTRVSLKAGEWMPLKSVLEVHFAGPPPEFFQWVGFALKVNYSGFFSEQGPLGPLLARAKAAAAKARESQSTSTGVSTGSPAPGVTT